MKKAENEIGYAEGKRAGFEMADRIHKTTYHTLENAIAIKQELISHFENKVGFSREMEQFNYDYLYNLGILDALNETLNKHD